MLPTIGDLGPTRLGRGARVLITGGFGFLGGHVLERLIGEREMRRIHVVDDLSSNPVPMETLLTELPGNGVLTYDVCTVAQYLQGSPDDFDVVLHFASVVGPAGVLRHGGRIVASVVADTYLLADYALERGSRLVDISTSEVYGGGREGLCKEDDSKIVPAQTSFRLEYAIGKLAAETALVNLHTSSGLDCVIARPFNIAGPRQSGEGGFVLPRFLAQAHLKLPLTIFGDGRARRAFSHVRDLADGVVRVGRHGAGGVAYNLGNHRNVLTVEQLADCVLRVTGSHSPKEHIDGMCVYGPHFVEGNDKFPEAGRAVSDLGWNPLLDIDAIVRDAWRYMTAASSETFACLAGRKLIEQLREAQSRA